MSLPPCSRGTGATRHASSAQAPAVPSSVRTVPFLFPRLTCMQGRSLCTSVWAGTSTSPPSSCLPSRPCTPSQVRCPGQEWGRGEGLETGDSTTSQTTSQPGHEHKAGPPSPPRAGSAGPPVKGGGHIPWNSHPSSLELPHFYPQEVWLL